MVFPTLSKHKRYASILVCAIIFFCHSGCAVAQSNPVQMFSNAMSCFNNKFIYSGCEEAYRLDRRGSIKVPNEALDLFCKGPCLTETQLVLDCVDNIVSNFLFDNKKTVHDIRRVVNMGCTYNSRISRGIFNFGGFSEGLLSNSERLRSGSAIYLYAASLIITWCCYYFIF